MSVKKDTYKIQAQTIIKNLARRNMEGFYCDTKEDAVKKALEIMEKGSVIAWGGSESIKECGRLGIHAHDISDIGFSGSFDGLRRTFFHILRPE